MYFFVFVKDKMKISVMPQLLVVVVHRFLEKEGVR